MRQTICIFLILFGAGCVIHSSFSQRLKSDEFNNPNLQSFWYLENGDNRDYTFTNGQLVINGRFNQDLWTDTSAMRFYQVTDQDEFTIETSMVIDYEAPCVVAGLVVYSPTTKDRQGRDGEWGALKVWGRGAEQGNNAVLSYQNREYNDPAPVLGYNRPQVNYNPAQGVIPIAMRLKRDGDVYETWFKPDAKGDWVSVSKVMNALQEPLEVGFYTGICRERVGRLTVSLDYFRVDAPMTPATLNFVIPSGVSIGEEFTVTLNIAGVVDLAGAQFDLHFNPTVLEPTDIHEGDFLSGGDAFFQVVHFNSVPGEISGIRIARTSSVDGGGVLLKVDFKAKGAGVSALEVRDLKLGTSVGTPISVEVVSGEIAVKPRTDVTGDGRVDILDLVRITRHFGPAAAAPAGLDINGDGNIDILDLILVARQLGT